MISYRQSDLIPTLQKQEIIDGSFIIQYYNDMITWNGIYWETDKITTKMQEDITNLIWKAMYQCNFDDTITENGKASLFIPSGDISVVNDIIKNLDSIGFECEMQFYEGTGQMRVGFKYYPNLKVGQ